MDIITDFIGYIECIEELNIAISKDPNNAKLYEKKAAYHFEMKNYTEAIKDFTKGIELKAGIVDDLLLHFYIGRAECYRCSKLYGNAIKDYSKIIDLCDRESAPFLNVYFNRINCYVAIKDYESAIKDCKYLLDNEETFEEYAEYGVFDELRGLYEKLKEIGFNDNNINKDKLKWLAHMESAGMEVKGGTTDKILAEYLRAYAIDSQRTVGALNDLINNPDFSCEHKEIFMQMPHLLTKFQDRMSGMNKDERIEFIELFLKEEENMRKMSNDNIDFSQLHYNPTQGRKLDL